MFGLNKYKYFILPLSFIAVTTFTSCDNPVFDEEGDCEVTYKLKFRYDLNLKWADAFANEVKSVRLYAFDETGKLIKEYNRNGSELASEDFSLELGLDPGKYELLAWCGTDNPDAKKNFAIPEATVGQTTIDELTCRLHRYEDEFTKNYSDDRLEFMFHGRMDVELPDYSMKGGEYTYTMPLTKDTNHLRVVLQHLSGEDINVSQFSFRVEEANGHLAHDNTLLDDDIITYRSYSKSQGEATIVKESTRDAVTSQTAIADLSVTRMMAHRSDKMVLTITNDKGEDIAKIPVIDYALLTKDYYEDAFGHQMTDQEFLDREDEYIMTLFLDEDEKWYSAEIYINSWRVVLNDYELN